MTDRGCEYGIWLEERSMKDWVDLHGVGKYKLECYFIITREIWKGPVFCHQALCWGK
jgi:hypothetical protein